MYPFAEQFLLCQGFFLYLPAAAAAVLHLVRPDELSERASRALAIGAVLSHAAFLLLRGIGTGEFPVRTGLESLILFLCVVTTLVLLVGRMCGLPSVVSFSLPVITLITGGSFLLAKPPEVPSGPSPLLLASHVSLTVLSYAAFTLGFLTGAMYLLQERQLKSRRPGKLLYLLPPLDVMERVTGRTIAVGYGMLTLGIALGAWGLAAFEPAAGGARPGFDDPKVVWTGLTWAAYTAVMLLRLIPRFRGRRVALVTVLGFGFVVISYFGLNWLGTGFHRF